MVIVYRSMHVEEELCFAFVAYKIVAQIKGLPAFDKI